MGVVVSKVGMCCNAQTVDNPEVSINPANEESSLGISLDLSGPNSWAKLSPLKQSQGSLANIREEGLGSTNQSYSQSFSAKEPKMYITRGKWLSVNELVNLADSRLKSYKEKEKLTGNRLRK